MSDVKNLIFDKIKEYDSIVIGRHFRPDGDAVGSTMGLGRIISLTYPEKKVYLSNKDKSEYMSFLGDTSELVDEEIIKNSLVIIIDTATEDRVSDERILKGKEVIKIDHHIEVAPYGDISWVEDWRSSASEMIASFYETFSSSFKIDTLAATMIYTGMVTDSGRFRFSSTSPETLRLAGIMVGKGVNIERLQANLDLNDYNFYKYQADVFSKIEMTENGVAWLYVDNEMQKKWNLTKEDASESVGFMSGIKGSICWIAFIDNSDGTIRVRLRSRFMTVNKIAEKYHGGGHDRASGATCYSKEEMEALIKDADLETKRFKESGEYWI
ncbi:MAG: bifunctional oligoribonuclease/PAP phosphatase NrnA [Spirochaetales bacterium]|nr:bifunctional oligoribonuclease/PAP phosphatase NrnA [Spirochaetales bacterium]